eukprot:2408809-Ditylum_brightwellii.AAC.1
MESIAARSEPNFVCRFMDNKILAPFAVVSNWELLLHQVQREDVRDPILHEPGFAMAGDIAFLVGLCHPADSSDCKLFRNCPDVLNILGVAHQVDGRLIVEKQPVFVEVPTVVFLAKIYALFAQGVIHF